MNKILLVGDNRLSKNWGGRGASIALYQLLNKDNRVIGSIYGGVLNNPRNLQYVNYKFPQKIFNHINTYGGSTIVGKYYLAFEKLLGAQKVIGENPSDNLKTILSNKNKHEYLRNILNKFEEADIIVIDGDGDMIFTTPPRSSALTWLTMVLLGKHMNKKVYFVNTVVSDCSISGRNQDTFMYAQESFRLCDTITVRDQESLEYINNNMSEIKTQFIPDSLFSWYDHFKKSDRVLPNNGNFILPYPEYQDNIDRIDFSKPYICIGGSALAPKFREQSIKAYTGLVNEIKKMKLNVYLTQNCGGDSFLLDVARYTNTPYIPVETSVMMAGAILANAQVFISGRYHPTIFASLGGTPCIFLKSHGHKMESIQELLGYQNKTQYSFPPNSKEIQAITELTEYYINNNEVHSKHIKFISKELSKKAQKLPDIIQ